LLEGRRGRRGPTRVSAEGWHDSGSTDVEAARTHHHLFLASGGWQAGQRVRVGED
jgi:hypothetical protein